MCWAPRDFSAPTVIFPSRASCDASRRIDDVGLTSSDIGGVGGVDFFVIDGGVRRRVARKPRCASREEEEADEGAARFSVDDEDEEEGEPTPAPPPPGGVRRIGLPLPRVGVVRVGVRPPFPFGRAGRLGVVRGSRVGVRPLPRAVERGAGLPPPDAGAATEMRPSAADAASRAAAEIAASVESAASREEGSASAALLLLHRGAAASPLRAPLRPPAAVGRMLLPAAAAAAPFTTALAAAARSVEARVPRTLTLGAFARAFAPGDLAAFARAPRAPPPLEGESVAAADAERARPAAPRVGVVVVERPPPVALPPRGEPGAAPSPPLRLPRGVFGRPALDAAELPPPPSAASDSKPPGRRRLILSAYRSVFSVWF